MTCLIIIFHVLLFQIYFLGVVMMLNMKGGETERERQLETLCCLYSCTYFFNRCKKYIFRQRIAESNQEELMFDLLEQIQLSWTVFFPLEYILLIAPFIKPAGISLVQITGLTLNQSVCYDYSNRAAADRAVAARAVAPTDRSHM